MKYLSFTFLIGLQTLNLGKLENNIDSNNIEEKGCEMLSKIDETKIKKLYLGT